MTSFSEDIEDNLNFELRDLNTISKDMVNMFIYHFLQKFNTCATPCLPAEFCENFARD